LTSLLRLSIYNIYKYRFRGSLGRLRVRTSYGLIS